MNQDLFKQRFLALPRQFQEAMKLYVASIQNNDADTLKDKLSVSFLDCVELQAENERLKILLGVQQKYIDANCPLKTK